MICGAAVSWVSGVVPAASAAAVTTTLNVEPGGYVCDTARLISGFSGSAFRASHAAVVSVPS